MPCILWWNVKRASNLEARVMFIRCRHRKHHSFYYRYNGFYLPLELYTPMFAVARIVGWSAHRMEELINADKIIRPAYKNVLEPAVYVPLNER